MKRRDFIVSSGVALGGTSAAIGLLQEPATALDFTIDGYDVGSASGGSGVSNLEDVDKVEITFDSFNLETQYLDTSEALTIQIDLNLKDKGGQVASSSKTYDFTGFSNGSNIDTSKFTSNNGSNAISVSNVGSNVNLQHYKNNVYSGSGLTDAEIYEKITVKADLTVTVSHPDLSTDKVHNQEFYISEDPHGLYDVVTRFGEASNLFNSYEKRILESTDSSAVFTVDNDGDGGDNVTYLDGLLSFHVASTSGFVTSSNKIEAIARDSNNERVTRESYVNGESPNDTASNTPFSYDAGDESGSYYNDTSP